MWRDTPIDLAISHDNVQFLSVVRQICNMPQKRDIDILEILSEFYLKRASSYDGIHTDCDAMWQIVMDFESDDDTNVKQ